MKLKQDIRLIAKALKEIHHVQPGVLMIVILKAFVDSLSPFLTIYLSAVIIDGIVSKRDIKYLFTITVITVGLEFLLIVISRILRRFLHIGLHTKYYFKKDMHEAEKMFDVDYVDIESSDFHRFMQKRSDLSKFNSADISFFAYRISSVIGNVFKILFSFVLTWELFWKTASATGIIGIACSGWGSIIMLAGILLSVYLQMRFTSKSSVGINKSLSHLADYTRTVSYYQDEVLSTYKGGKDIRLYGMKQIIDADFAKNLSKIKKPLRSAEKTASCYMILLTVVECLLNILIYIFIGLKTLSGIFGVGSVVRYVGAIKEFSNALIGLMNDFSEMRARTEAISMYFDYMNMPSVLKSGGKVLADPDKMHEIVFQDVGFRYPNTDSFCLRNINIRIRAGERLAVVGPNGSGKTTFIKLLCRLYDPDEGRILLDGIDIREYRYEDYLSVLSVVFQDFKLFSFSLGQNVASGVNVDQKRAEECLCQAGFGERFNTLDQKLDTFLYHDFDLNGVEVSGGEAQKIALARALYKNSSVVILDEPTAALDPISEYEIYSRFDNMIEQKTAVYISHRLSSCRFCDEIAVFDKGHIVQLGAHRDLVKDTLGLYYKLWYAQAQYYESPKTDAV